MGCTDIIRSRNSTSTAGWYLPYFGPTTLRISAYSFYIFYAALVACSPDVDSPIARILRLSHHQNHRTWSHSILGSILCVPLLSIGLYRMLVPLITFPHALAICLLCFYSHLLADWITAYGIRLCWRPGRETPLYNLGVITIFDFVNLIIWYTAFIISWHNWMHPALLLFLFMSVDLIWLSYKRILLYVAFKHTHTLSKAPLNDIWLQPASFNPFVFGYWQYQGPQVGPKLIAEIHTRRVAWPAYRSYWTLLKDSIKDGDLGFSRAAPRDALTVKVHGNRDFKRWMRRKTLPCLALVALHTIWFIYSAYLRYHSTN